jgi:hypothetical protein
MQLPGLALSPFYCYICVYLMMLYLLLVRWIRQIAGFG